MTLKQSAAVISRPETGCIQINQNRHRKEAVREYSEVEIPYREFSKKWAVSRSATSIGSNLSVSISLHIKAGTYYALGELVIPQEIFL